MARLYNRFWVGVTIVLSAAVIILDFPVFVNKYGYPGEVIMTITVVLGIWRTYFNRAYFFSRTSCV